jgi:heat shock protein HslJ
MKLIGYLPLLAAPLLFAACTTRPVPSPADTAPGTVQVAPAPKIVPLETLAGTSWTLVELNGEPAPEPLPGWTRQTLRFHANGLALSGNAGVNRFGGRYEAKGASLSFGPLAMTRRLGPAAQMEAEKRYTRALTNVTAWRQDGARLVLTGPGEGRQAVFERAPNQPE